MEARKLAALIGSRKLDVALYRCYSACTLVFAAGERRIVAEEAILGFHGYEFPGMKPQDFHNEYRHDKRYLASRGIKSGFIDRIYSTPASDMWNPTNDELLKSGFVTETIELNGASDW